MLLLMLWHTLVKHGQLHHLKFELIKTLLIHFELVLFLGLLFQLENLINLLDETLGPFFIRRVFQRVQVNISLLGVVCSKFAEGVEIDGMGRAKRPIVDLMDEVLHEVVVLVHGYFEVLDIILDNGGDWYSGSLYFITV